jgi:hypothetical protein
MCWPKIKNTGVLDKDCVSKLGPACAWPICARLGMVLSRHAAADAARGVAQHCVRAPFPSPTFLLPIVGMLPSGGSVMVPGFGLMDPAKAYQPTAGDLVVPRLA